MKLIKAAATIAALTVCLAFPLSLFEFKRSEKAGLKDAVNLLSEHGADDHIAIKHPVLAPSISPIRNKRGESIYSWSDAVQCNICAGLDSGSHYRIQGYEYEGGGRVKSATFHYRFDFLSDKGAITSWNSYTGINSRTGEFSNRLISEDSPPTEGQSDGLSFAILDCIGSIALASIRFEVDLFPIDVVITPIKRRFYGAQGRTRFYLFSWWRESVRLSSEHKMLLMPPHVRAVSFRDVDSRRETHDRNCGAGTFDQALGDVREAFSRSGPDLGRFKELKKLLAN